MVRFQPNVESLLTVKLLSRRGRQRVVNVLSTCCQRVVNVLSTCCPPVKVDVASNTIHADALTQPSIIKCGISIIKCGISIIKCYCYKHIIRYYWIRTSCVKARM